MGLCDLPMGEDAVQGSLTHRLTWCLSQEELSMDWNVATLENKRLIRHGSLSLLLGRGEILETQRDLTFS